MNTPNSLDNEQKNIIEIIKKVPPFVELDHSEILSLLNILQKIDCQAGEVIFKEGEKGNEAFIVLNGELSLEKMGRVIKVLQVICLEKLH